jgi:hypothetical protein
MSDLKKSVYRLQNAVNMQVSGNKKYLVLVRTNRYNRNDIADQAEQLHHNVPSPITLNSLFL